MNEFDLGTLVASLALDDSQFVAQMNAASGSITSFAETSDLAAGQFGALPEQFAAAAGIMPKLDEGLVSAAGSLGGLALNSGDAAVNQASLTAATVDTTTAMTGLYTPTLTAKGLIAQWKEEARLAALASGTLTTETVAASVSFGTLGAILGTTALAVVAFGPKLYELVGGWDGIKKAGGEAWVVLEDLGEILGFIGGTALDILWNSLKTTIGALSDLGGGIITAIDWLGEFTGAWSLVSGVFGFVTDGIHSVAEAIRIARADEDLAALAEELTELKIVADGFGEQPPLSFGIDPNDSAAIAAFIREVDAAVKANDPFVIAQLQVKEALEADAKAAKEAAAAQAAYNKEIANLVDQFSGAGALELAQKYEIVLGKLGGATALSTEEQSKFFEVFQAVIDQYAEMGPKGAAVVAHFTDLRSALPFTTALLEEYRAELQALEIPIEKLSGNLEELSYIKPPFEVMQQDLFDLESTFATTGIDGLLTNLGDELKDIGTIHAPIVSYSIRDVSLAFLEMGSILPGVLGSVMTFIGNAINGFLTLEKIIRTQIPDAIGDIKEGFSQGFSLSGISGVIGGIGGIVSAASTAIGVVMDLGAAIKRAFTDEETELVNPNRDLFMLQFAGSDPDPWTATANSTIKAAMQVYGLDWNAAWTQYAEPLILQLQQADTYAEFRTAQMAIAELFKQAGVTVDLVNEAGQASQYQSSVFDTGYSAPAFTAPAYTPTTSSLPVGSITPDLTNAQKQFDMAIAGGDEEAIADAKLALETLMKSATAGSVYGAYAGGTYSGSTFQTGSMGSMGSGGPCIVINGPIYVNGASGQQQAASFFQQIYQYIASGGQGMEQFRDLVCAAGPA